MSDAITEFLVGTAVWFSAAWMVMLELGAAHSHDGNVPAPGYWTVFWILGALSSAAYLFGRGVHQAFKE